MRNYNDKGKITLVGAGPGDPDLITLKAVKVLNKADVVFYDALVNPLILDHARQANQIFVGKRKGLHRFPQGRINEMMVAAALEGKQVVRLKGGDAMVFGRAMEELSSARSLGLEVNIVAGISAYSGIVAEQQIPLTKRCTYESFWVCTGYTCDGGISEDIYLAAQSSATVVVYMGMTHIDQIVTVFRQYKGGNYPVGIYQEGTLDTARHVVGNLDNIVALKTQHAIQNPAIIVFGPAVLEGIDPTGLAQQHKLAEVYHS
jgi:uroporphyrin-III C-methyltransferase